MKSSCLIALILCVFTGVTVLPREASGFCCPVTFPVNTRETVGTPAPSETPDKCRFSECACAPIPETGTAPPFAAADLYRGAERHGGQGAVDLFSWQQFNGRDTILKITGPLPAYRQIPRYLETNSFLL